MHLSDIIKPSSFTFDKRPGKVFLAGKHARLPTDKELRWFGLYCDITETVRAFAEPKLVEGSVSSVALILQVRGSDVGKFVAFASPTCGIGSVRLGLVDGLGECVLPEPFGSLASLARN